MAEQAPEQTGTVAVISGKSFTVLRIAATIANPALGGGDNLPFERGYTERGFEELRASFVIGGLHYEGYL
jgi:hypothetical protein